MGAQHQKLTFYQASLKARSWTHSCFWSSTTCQNGPSTPIHASLPTSPSFSGRSRINGMLTCYCKIWRIWKTGRRLGRWASIRLSARLSGYHPEKETNSDILHPAWSYPGSWRIQQASWHHHLRGPYLGQIDLPSCWKGEQDFRFLHEEFQGLHHPSQEGNIHSYGPPCYGIRIHCLGPGQPEASSAAWTSSRTRC